MSYREISVENRRDMDFQYPMSGDILERYRAEHDVLLQVYCEAFGWIAGADGEINASSRFK